MDENAINKIFGERLSLALKLRAVSPSELAEATGISTGTISRYRSGTQSARSSQIRKICDVLKLNEAWIIGMDDSMEPGQKNETGTTRCVDDVSGPAPEALSQTEQGLIEIFRSLSFQGQLKVLNLASELQKEEAGIQ